MNIFCITLEQSKVQDVNLLNWLTQEENKAGVNTERYWMINTNVNLNPNSEESHRLGQLIHLALVHNFQSIMIKKDV
jgi:hypothetical protein